MHRRKAPGEVPTCRLMIIATTWSRHKHTRWVVFGKVFLLNKRSGVVQFNIHVMYAMSARGILMAEAIPASPKQANPAILASRNFGERKAYR